MLTLLYTHRHFRIRIGGAPTFVFILAPEMSQTGPGLNIILNNVFSASTRWPHTVPQSHTRYVNAKVNVQNSQITACDASRTSLRYVSISSRPITALAGSIFLRQGINLARFWCSCVMCHQRAASCPVDRQVNVTVAWSVSSCVALNGTFESSVCP
jgi:hypothetical protein